MTSSRRCYIGSYTGDDPSGIRVFDLGDDDTLTPVSEVNGIENASYLAMHPVGHVLYAVSETVPEGSVVAYAVDPADGSLREIDRAPSQGAAPCHLAVTVDGGALAVANYVSGSVTHLVLDTDGRFGETHAARHGGSGPHARQEAPHAHCVVADGERFHVVDLGIDRIVHYGPPTGSPWRPLGHTVVHPGAGPRHLVLDPSRRRAFVVGELDLTVVALSFDPTTGAMEPRHTVPTLRHEGRPESLAAAIRLHPDGRHLYVTNRGDDSIAVFDVSDRDAAPRPIGHVPSGGRTPRDLVLDARGRRLLVANQDSDAVTAFAIDADTGLPRQIGVVAEVSRPVCVLVVEAPA